MTRQIFRNGIWVCAVLVMFPVGLLGQTAPKTPWGDPDLQGTYTNKTITPLERPDAVGEKQFLTDEEVAEQEQARLDRNEELLLAEAERTVAGGNVGGYNNFWLDRGTTAVGTRRTSLIVDPPNGRLPELTPEARRLADSAEAARIADVRRGRRPARSYTCLLYTSPSPRD